MTRAWMVVAPLVFAALLIAHPMGDTFYVAASEHNTAWLTVHVGRGRVFLLMAAVVWFLLRGLHGRAALVARASLLVFAVVYTAWEVMTVSRRPRPRARDVEGVERITTHWISGEFGLFNSVGALAWTAAIAAAVVALRDAPRGVRIALGVSVLMTMHIPPIGPIALLALAYAAARGAPLGRRASTTAFGSRERQRATRAREGSLGQPLVDQLITRVAGTVHRRGRWQTRGVCAVRGTRLTRPEHARPVGSSGSHAKRELLDAAAAGVLAVHAVRCPRDRCTRRLLGLTAQAGAVEPTGVPRERRLWTV